MKIKSLLSRSSIAVAVMLSMGATQASAVDRNNEEEVVKIDARSSRFDYRQGELIVKFKELSPVRVMNTKGKFRTASVKAVDAVMNELGGFEMEELMPLSGSIVSKKILKSYSGAPIKDSNLGKLYRVKFDATKVQSVHEAIEKFKAMSDVEFAEPNYMIYATSTDAEAYATDPLYSQQWGFDAINLPALWNAPKITDKRPVIAIIDTGVEFTHSDLFDNVWANEKELTGEEGVDDDGNGFVDDMYGWDFVNQNNRMDDYNGHGTHCAGIAAATASNGKGGVGANPDALIMPVSVLQSDGAGDIATFIKGIDYATANGADVISMSLGSYAESTALEQALAKAYQNAVLVAAAGNDSRCIYPHKCGSLNKQGSPMFPAAYTFVLGVQASAQGGGLASFSNYDEDGPIYFNSDFFSEEQQYNYELTAPGVNVMSTYPGGKYKALNGTSMACPLVAGAISRLLQCKDYASKEVLFGDLIHSTTSAGNLDIYAAYLLDDSKRQPTLWNIANELNDTEGGDGDMRADAGETIKIYPTLRNDWGLAQNINISLEMGENEDASLVQFLANGVDFGSDLSSYAKGKSANPIVIKISDDCVDGRRIKLRLRATCDNISSELVQDFTITVENGVEIGGMITENTTLYPNVHYIVTKTLLVPEGVTLTILPGTVLRFKSKVGFNATKGSLVCSGTPEQPIIFTMADLTTAIYEKWYFYDELNYVIFEDLRFDHTGSTGEFSINLYNVVNNCILRNIQSNKYVLNQQDLIKCNLYNLDGTWVLTNSSYLYGLYHTNFIKNRDYGADCREDEYIYNSNAFSNVQYYSDNSYKKHEVQYAIGFNSSKIESYIPQTPNYLGTGRKDFAEMRVLDYDHPIYPIGNGSYDLSNMLTRPSAEAHGIVWKVVVNGYDAQDEYELLPPLGVGRHKFEVYFNRPMNTAVAPTIAMGVRPPYTQNSIAEDGTWSADSLVYTAYLTITGKSATDGVNRIYVAGAEDNEYFEIPVEDMRFNVNVQSAGSMSTGLMAEAGLGKVNLTWETDEEDFEDLLGYNIIRYTEHVDSIYEKDYSKYGDYKEHLVIKGDTTIINKTLIESQEQSFTDYDVVPGTTYYYYIQQMTTSLASHNLSNVVASTPLTAAKGDANGSMCVDVADVVTEVAYMTKQNPQPFIFEAADVNSDLAVNVLDVVGTINIIRNPAGTSAMSVNSTAVYTIEDGILYVECPVALGGVQFRFKTGEGAEITPLEALNGFETISDNQGENGYLFFAFSMTGKTLATGKQALLRIGNAEITEVTLCDATGKSVVGIDGNTSGVGAIEAMQMELPYPNPFSDVLTVPYKVGKDGVHDVKIVVSTVTGATVAMHTEKAEYGFHSWTWNAGKDVANGVYLVSLYVDGRLMQTAKAVKR
ncbi:MAG: hypothetical protein E7080_01825 [Bacteroidales bacterium]|nr:hypothetical protein [Bacteroidales bacterium]